jgi:hypothetical protein
MKILLTIAILITVVLGSEDPNTTYHNMKAIEQIKSANPYGHKYPGKAVIPRINNSSKIDFKIMVHPREGYLEMYNTKKKIRPGSKVTAWNPISGYDLSKGKRPHDFLLDVAFFHNKPLYNKWRFNDDAWLSKVLQKTILYPFVWVYYKSSLSAMQHYQNNFARKQVLKDNIAEIMNYELFYVPHAEMYRLIYWIVVWPFILMVYRVIFTYAFGISILAPRELYRYLFVYPEEKAEKKQLEKQARKNAKAKIECDAMDKYCDALEKLERNSEEHKALSNISHAEMMERFGK